VTPRRKFSSAIFAIRLRISLALEPLRRAYCARFGHRVVRDDRGAPVTDFEVCRRCGKFERSFFRV
jgi:hypothetical protein